MKRKTLLSPILILCLMLTLLVSAPAALAASGDFTDIGAGLEGAHGGSVAWGDYDNDGDLDVLMAGSFSARVYRNDGGSFVDIGAGLPGIYRGGVVWGDYDNDSDLDILITASDGMGRIYRNDSGAFTNIRVALPGGALSWGDYDNDGWLDILDVGTSSVYHNDGGGVFTDIGAGLPVASYGAGAWGDYDNDGDLDILITGALTYGSNLYTRIYRNDTGVFTDIGAGLTGVNSSAVDWGDYDNDGDLDILISGCCNITKIYRNDSGTANTAPSAPTGLAFSVNGSTADLSWNASMDAQTPANGLTYNVRVGTTLGGSQVVTPMANIVSGYRRLSAMGNAQLGTSFILNNLPPGTYYWSVQAVDSAFAGSPFAPEGSFTIGTTNRPPYAAPSGGGVYELNSNVILGGNVSDYDGDLLTYKWLEGETILFEGTIQPVAGGDPIALPNHVISTLSLGTHTINLQVSDAINTPVLSSITVQILDTTVPTLAPVSNKTILWPPNHQMIDINIQAHATDNGGQVTLSAYISSNEPINGLGDGDQAPDWTEPVINQQTGVITFQLRAERSGTGSGRIYTITISATDNSNNTSTANLEIIVPHDKKK